MKYTKKNFLYGGSSRTLRTMSNRELLPFRSPTLKSSTKKTFIDKVKKRNKVFIDKNNFMLFIKNKNPIPEELKSVGDICKRGNKGELRDTEYQQLIIDKENFPIHFAYIMTEINSKKKKEYLCRGFIVFEYKKYNKTSYTNKEKYKKQVFDRHHDLQQMVNINLEGINKFELGKEGLIENLPTGYIPEFTIHGLNINLICLDYNRKIQGGIVSPRGTHITPPLFNTKIDTLLTFIVKWSKNKINYITLDSIPSAYAIYLHYGFIPFIYDKDFINIITGKKKNKYKENYDFKSALEEYNKSQLESKKIRDNFVAPVTAKRLGKKWREVVGKRKSKKANNNNSSGNLSSNSSSNFSTRSGSLSVISSGNNENSNSQ